MKKLILSLTLIFAVHISYLSAQPSSPLLENPPKETDVVVLPAVLDWSNVSGAECYFVEIVTDTLGPVSEEHCVTTTSSYVVPDGILASDTKYYWRVKAHNNEGWGEFSGYYSFTTQANTEIGTIENLADGVIDLIAEEDIPQNQGNILVNRLEQVSDKLENNQPTVALIHMYIFKARIILLRFLGIISSATYDMLNYSTDGVIDLIAEEDTPPNTNVLNEMLIPKSYALLQNYPNPFNPSTTIEYSVPQSTFVTLKVYDMLGREVATLVSKNQQTGTYIVDWNASAYSSGVYFYRLTAGSFAETKKMILSK